MAFPYYPFFPGDYLRDTRRLTLLQHGAYRLLIDEYMSSGKPLRGDLDSMCRVCGALSGEERKAVEFVLAEFFTMDGPLWRHTRCDRELAKMASRHESARESAKVRWGSERNANAMRTHSEGNANQNQNQNQIPEPNPKPAPEEEKPTSKALRPTRQKAAGSGAPTVPAWEAYCKAYFARYGTEPVRNARVNGQLAQLVGRLGAAEAPQVAAYYVGSNHKRYVAAGHALGPLLQDAEALRTAWATGATKAGGSGLDWLLTEIERRKANAD